MRAIVISRPGGPEVLEWREVPDPVPGPDDVLVRVRATAVNRADLLQRRGRYPAPSDAPADIPGLEFAGEVEARGSGVEGFGEGDRVMGILGGGSYAEKVAVHHGLCMSVPPSLDWEAAAAVPEAFLTAFDALFVQGGLGEDETLLVQAAGSGVGTAALQLGRAAGARVIGLSRTAEKRRALRRFGLEPVLDPAAEDPVNAILSASGGEGVDLVLDMVGAAAWPLHEKVLRERGRIVVIGLLGGARCEIDLSALMRKRLILRGSVLRTRKVEEKIALTREFSERMLPLLADGRLRPWIDRSLPLERIAEAHEVMERNENLGKIVIVVAED